MAAELIGTTIGAIGLLGQLFDGCVKAYGFFTTATHLDQDSQKLLCKVRIEEMRLVAWGREWGVAEGKLEAHLKMESNPKIRELATEIMRQLHNTVTNFQVLQQRYGLVDHSSTVSSTEGKGASKEKPAKSGKDSPSPSRKGSESSKDPVKSNGKNGNDRSWRKEIALRTKWVIGGE
jgi:hypothetical protein